MIDRNAIKVESIKNRENSSLVERDYIEGWLLYAISNSSIAPKIAFKGGTALSRVYYSEHWRHSDDLDFAVVDDMEWDEAIKAMSDEVPRFLMERAQIQTELRHKIHTNPVYMQARMKYVGPIGPNTIKVEMTRSEVSDVVVVNASVPAYFDCPKFKTRAYSLETVMAEKIQALVERGYARDYYDVWRLLGEGGYNAGTVRCMFATMCRARGIDYGIGNVGAEGVAEYLEQYLEKGLARLLRGDIPPLEDIVDETRRGLKAILGSGPPT